MRMETGFPRLGIALGGGAARGWAHIGVLRALAEHDIEPAVVCGTSVGALIGGIFAAGKLVDFERWVVRLTRRDVLSLADFTMAGGGAIRGQRLMDLYRQHIQDVAVEDLPVTYAAVATDLNTGAEVWLQQGSLLTAIRASISLPGLLTPVYVEGRLLADGGLVNPVPVNLCRALGADLVIGVDLNSNRLNRSRHRSAGEAPRVVKDPSWLTRLGNYLRDDQPDGSEKVEALPRFSRVLAASLQIMQDRISRSRLAGDPPDLLLAPRLGHVDPLDFANGRPTIEEGYNSVRRMMPALQHLLDI